MAKKHLESAYALLREKAHTIGHSFATHGASSTGDFGGGPVTVKTEVDGMPRTDDEIIELAAQYPEWKQR